MNPYEGLHFFGFLKQIFLRTSMFFAGYDLTLASDELQILTLIGITISTSLIGSFLVLRKMTMLANSISHTILLGIVGVYIFSHNGLIGEMVHQEDHKIGVYSLLFAALLTGLLTSFLSEFLNKVLKIQEDASVGLVFTSLFAIGVVLVTVLTRNAHIGSEIVMGNVDALHVDDLNLVWIIAGINILAIVLFFKEFKITTFEAGLAQTLGISPTFFNYFLMALVSITVVGAFRAVGVIMVLALITGPVLAARRLTQRLSRMILLSILIGSLACISGVALARHFLSAYGWSLSTGGLVVCAVVFLFALSLSLRALPLIVMKKRSADPINKAL